MRDEGSEGIQSCSKLVNIAIISRYLPGWQPRQAQAGRQSHTSWSFLTSRWICGSCPSNGGGGRGEAVHSSLCPSWLFSAGREGNGDATIQGGGGDGTPWPECAGPPRVHLWFRLCQTKMMLFQGLWSRRRGDVMSPYPDSCLPPAVQRGLLFVWIWEAHKY